MKNDDPTIFGPHGEQVSSRKESDREALEALVRSELTEAKAQLRISNQEDLKKIKEDWSKPWKRAGLAVFVVSIAVNVWFFFDGKEFLAKKTREYTQEKLNEPYIRTTVDLIVRSNAQGFIERELTPISDQVETIKFAVSNATNVLAAAIKAVDQRTSGIEKLPDGRTKMGPVISGSPSILFAQLEAAHSHFVSSNYASAFAEVTNAIFAYESSERSDVSMVTGGNLTPEGVRMMYGMAAESAGILKNFDLALKFGQKLSQIDDSPDVRLFVIGQLLNLTRTNDAVSQLTNSIAKYPNDTRLTLVQKLLNRQ